MFAQVNFILHLMLKLRSYAHKKMYQFERYDLLSQKCIHFGLKILILQKTYKLAPLAKD